MDNVFSGIITSVADFGFTVVAGAVVIFVMVKVCNSLIKRNDTITDSISPKMDQVLSQLSAVENTVNEHISSHNSSSKIQLHELDTKIDQLITQQNEIISNLDKISKLQIVLYTMTMKNQPSMNSSLTDIIDIEK